MRHTDANELRAAAEAALPLRQLNERSREIFKRIVETYLATGEPVGSRNLSRALPMTLSPASVRNVMSDLEQLGLIYAPHTSAGRLPTEGETRALRTVQPYEHPEYTVVKRRVYPGTIVLHGEHVIETYPLA